MKTEAEIREHVADLQWGRDLPCACPPGAQSEDCRVGALMMSAATEALLWALGERAEYDQLVIGLGVAHALGKHGTCHHGQPRPRKET